MAKTSTTIAVVLIVLLLAALSFVVVIYTPGGCSIGQGTSCSTTTKTTSSQSAGNISPASGTTYLGAAWGITLNGQTPTALNILGFPEPSYTPYWTSGSLTAGTQYVSSGIQSFSLANGFCAQIYSNNPSANAVVSYPEAYCPSSQSATNAQGYIPINSASGLIPGGFPNFADQINPTATCLVSSTSTGCIGLAPKIPGSYDNGSGSVSAVTSTLIPGWGGSTTLPASGTIWLAATGVSARGGGTGMDQCVDTQVLSTGISTEPIPSYSSNGAISAAPMGSLVPAYCQIVLQENQTGFLPNGLAQILSRQQVSGTTAFTLLVPASDIYTSSSVPVPNTSCPKYTFVCIAIPFTYSGTTGAHIEFTWGFLDDQIAGNIINNAVLNNGLTGTTGVCGSAVGTNVCMNSTDIVTGTAQVNYGLPAAWLGGGAASNTQPSYLPQKQTSIYPGWAYFAPLDTMVGGTVVYAT